MCCNSLSFQFSSGFCVLLCFPPFLSRGRQCNLSGCTFHTHLFPLRVSSWWHGYWGSYNVASDIPYIQLKEELGKPQQVFIFWCHGLLLFSVETCDWGKPGIIGCCKDRYLLLGTSWFSFQCFISRDPLLYLKQIQLLSSGILCLATTAFVFQAYCLSLLHFSISWQSLSLMFLVWLE